MSTIDLERLIVRQTYFVPLDISKANDGIFKALQEGFEKIAGVTAWAIMKHIGNYICYTRDYQHHAVFGYIIKEKLQEKPKELRQRKTKEFLDGLRSKFPESYYDIVRNIRGNTPDTLHVSFKPMENGCECKVECLPALYRKLSQLHEEPPNDFQIQDAFLSCKRFVANLFESGLSATLIREEKKERLKPTVQLLINDQSSHQILLKIEEMLKHTTGEVLLCGWIGTLLLPKLREIKQKGVNIRVITHKAKELKGKPGHQDVQRAFKELISMIGKDNVSIRPECHCRVVVVDNKALIGSMDINAISLTGSHRELAIYTEDPEIVRNLRKYFNGIFSPLSKEKAK